MAAPVIGTRPRFAPPASAKIDHSDPISSGMTFCYVPSLGPTELTNGFSALQIGSVSRQASSFGDGWKTEDVGGTGNGWRFTGPPDSNYLNSMTLMFVGRFAAITTNILMSKGQSSGPLIPFHWYVGAGAFGGVTLRIRRGDLITSREYWKNGLVLSTGNQYTLFMTTPWSVAFGLPTFWVNGTRYQADTQDGNASNAVAGNNYPIGVGINGSGNSSHQTVFNIAAAWNRVLSDAEIIRLTADPFVFFRY